MPKKGCFNEKCSVRKREHKYGDKFEFCPMCGNELGYVCGNSKCYKPLLEVRKGSCDTCLAQKEENKIERKKNAIEIPKVVVDIAKAIAAVATIIPLAKTIGESIPKK